MKFFITFDNLNFESLKKLSLGKKIVIAIGLEFGPWDYFSLIVFALTITLKFSWI